MGPATLAHASASNANYMPQPSPQVTPQPRSRILLQASAPASIAAAAHTGDYVSGECYRYALTNFVRTSIQTIITFPLTGHPIPHMDSKSDSDSLGHHTPEGRGLGSQLEEQEQQIAGSRLPTD